MGLTIRNFTIAIFLLVFTGVSFGQTDQVRSISQLKFSFLSIRKMTTEEKSILAKHYIGSDELFLAKFRIENTDLKTPLYFFFNFPAYIYPEGYFIKKTDTGIVWLEGGTQQEHITSPGLRPEGKSGVWTALEKGMAIEWEVIEKSSGSSETHARTIFMTVGRDGIMSEVFSDFYKVPAKISQ